MIAVTLLKREEETERTITDPGSTNTNEARLSVLNDARKKNKTQEIDVKKRKSGDDIANKNKIAKTYILKGENSQLNSAIENM